MLVFKWEKEIKINGLCHGPIILILFSCLKISVAINLLASTCLAGSTASVISSFICFHTWNPSSEGFYQIFRQHSLQYRQHLEKNSILVIFFLFLHFSILKLLPRGCQHVNEEDLLVEHGFVLIGLIKILRKFKILPEKIKKNSVI